MRAWAPLIARAMSMDSAIFQMKLTGGMANTADAIGFVGRVRKGPSL